MNLDTNDLMAVMSYPLVVCPTNYYYFFQEIALEIQNNIVALQALKIVIISIHVYTTNGK